MGLIQTAESIEQHVKAAYTALQQNGASLPEQRNLANLAGVIGKGGGEFNPEIYRENYGAVVVAATDNESSMPGGIIPVKTSTDFQKMCSPATATISGVKFSMDRVMGYIFGDSCTDVPNHFGSYCTNLCFLHRTKVIVQIGSSFCEDTKICLPIAFSAKLTTIGNDFLRNSCINANVHIPASTTSFGTGFMVGTDFFTGSLIVDGDISPTDALALSSSVTTFPNYTKGVTITGQGASAWKSKLKNSSVYPYRKLILG